MTSPRSAPTSTAGCQMDSDLKRSNTPLWMSVFRATPVYIVIMMTLTTRMPGRSCCRYSRGEPASAPPNR